MRTSSTHPPAIASVQVGNGLGRIGLSFCPGKQQRDSATGGWARDLAAETLGGSKDYGPGVLEQQWKMSGLLRQEDQAIAAE
ncbi:hypothetical protein ABC347_06090 [Sphingomonas sp. 1P06PA]|uniref:hypothetical protein n=1 Tax=Sphingomonas sp. 1P06PA TaxID=554121 RepID=UPI0039A6EB44